MLLREVEYARPASVQEAVRLLSDQEGARALAGGQSLVNVMKARAASPDALVDLNGLDELRGIELAADGTLTIGAMTTYTELAASAEARARPILGEVCLQIADVQVRNRGTIGGVDAVPVLLTPASADADAVRAAVQGASLDPPSDVHASAAYRRHLAEVLAVRAVNQAAERS